MGLFDDLQQQKSTKTTGLFDDLPSFDAAKPDQADGIIDTLGQGFKAAGQASSATIDSYLGNNQGVVDTAKSNQELQQRKDPRLQAFYGNLESGFDPEAEGFSAFTNAVGTVGSAIWDNPTGAGLAVVEQFPNAIPALAGGYAGMKAGALTGGAAGSVIPGAGTGAGAVIGGVIGGVAGMFGGNTLIETGHKAMEKAGDGEYTEAERQDAISEGATKAGVITAVDVATLGAGRLLSNGMARTTQKAMDAATRRVLVDKGIDIADAAAVASARQSPEILNAVQAAQRKALKATDKLGRRAVEAGTLMTMETVGEGVGEYLGELAATGDADISDAVLESFLSLGQSSIEAGYNMAGSRGSQGAWGDQQNPNDIGIASGLIQPTPTPDNPAPAPVERPDPSNGPISAAAAKMASAQPAQNLPVPYVHEGDVLNDYEPNWRPGNAEPNIYSTATSEPAQLPPGTGQMDMGRESPERTFTPTPTEYEGLGRNVVERQAGVDALRLENRKTITQGEMIELTRQFREAVTTKPVNRTDEQKQLIKALPKLKQQVNAGTLPVTQNMQSDLDPQLAGQPIDAEWTEFAPQSGTLSVPRAQMPQVKAEHRGALVNFLNAKGVESEQIEVDPVQLKPTQQEFSPEKVDKARQYKGGERSILISSDGHVVDGHHQWMAKREKGEPVKAIQLQALIRDLLPLVNEFPSSEQDAGITPVTADPTQAQAPRLIMRKQGQPFPSEQHARNSIPFRQSKGQAEIVPVEGGFAVQTGGTNPVVSQEASISDTQAVPAASSDPVAVEQPSFRIEPTDTSVRAMGDPQAIRQKLREGRFPFKGAEIEGGLSFGKNQGDRIRSILGESVANERALTEQASDQPESVQTEAVVAEDRPEAAEIEQVKAEPVSNEPQAEASSNNAATGASTESPQDDLPPILKLTRTRYINQEAKAQGIKKGSPGYAGAIARIEEEYEADLDKAYAAISFEQYNALNSDTPESLNRQAWEGLREAFGQSENDTRFSRTPETRSLTKSIQDQYPGVKLRLAENDSQIELALIDVPQDQREQGIGSAIMSRLVEHADKEGKALVLSPSAEFGGNKARLTEWYKRFGFVENKGKNRDYEVSETMYRPTRFSRVDTELDMSYAARMQRALDQGFVQSIDELYEVKAREQGRDRIHQSGQEGERHTPDARSTGTAADRPQTFYHGTAADIERFDLGHSGRKDSGWLGEGIYLTDQPDLANHYAKIKAGGSGGNVMPVMVRLQNPYIASLSDKARLQGAAPEETQAFTKRLQELGYDGAILAFADVKEIVVFEPAQVRSTSAAFDPELASESDILLSRADNAGPTISRDQVEATATRITSNWTNAPEMVTVATDRDLPADLQETIDKQNARGKIDGVFHKGRFYLVADKIRTEADVERIVLHEALGHYGLRQLYGPAFGMHMDRLFNRVGGYPGIQRLSKKHGFDLSSYWENAGDMSLSERREMMADELIAHIAGTGTVQPDLIQQIAHLIRKGLRKIMAGTRFAERLDQMTDVEVLRIVAAARKAVVEGESRITVLTHDPRFVRDFETIVYGDTRFSRVPDDAPVIETDGGPIAKGKTVKEMALRAREYARKHFVGRTVRNEDHGDDIAIPMSGIRHTIQGAQEPLLKTVAVTPEILEQGVYLESRTEKRGDANVEAIHYFGAKVRVDGELHDVVAVVKQRKDGKWYYDHSIERKVDGSTDAVSYSAVAPPTEMDTTTSTDSIEDDQDVRFSRTDENANSEESAVERAQRTLGNNDRNAWDKVKRTFKRNFTAAGLLPDSVFREKVLRDSEVNAHEFDTAHYIGALDRAISKAYGTPYRKLTDAQREAIDAQMKSTEPDMSIPEPVRVALMDMRRSIAGLSQQYAEILQQQVEELQAQGNDADAMEKAALLETIINNMDTYAHRSYRAFDDPDWPAKVSKDPEIFPQAIEYLKGRYLEQGMTYTQAEQAAIRTARTILEEGTAYEDMSSFIKESKLGSKDLSTLKRRKDIAPEIRALLGEYKDVKINYAKTLAKMSRLVANTKLLDRIKEIGLAEGWLFTEDNKPLDQSVTKVAGDASEVYAPLNGYYVPNEINQALIDTLGKEQMADWLRAVIRMNGMVKYGKTVLSPTTAFRNWMSAAFFAMANGHFDITQMRKSVSGFSEYFGHGENPEKVAYLRKLKELGVVYDTAYAGEMMDLLKDSNLENTVFSKGPFQSLKAANELAQKFYQYGDDFWKIMGFENEKAMLMKHKGMSEAEAEVEAAERIRNTYPTYSMTGRAVNWLRRFPLAGTFVSFPAEVIRTQFHMLRYLKQDWKDSPAYAARKIVGLAMVSGLAYAAQALSKDLFDIGDDEEEAVRLMAASWNSNSNIWFMGRDEKGNIRYLDFSFLDPYNYFKRPINAVMRDQPLDKAAIQAASEMLSPFFGTDIAFGAISEIWNNKKEGGGRIYNPQDMALDQAQSIANHLRKAIQPGFVGNMERAWMAANDQVTASGKQYKAEEELAAFFGFRASTFDPKTALYYNSFEFKDRKRDATAVLMNVAKDPNSVSDGDLMKAYDTASRARLRAYTDMIRLMEAARAAGMNNMQLNVSLRRSGISKEDIRALMQGRIPAWRPDQRMMRNTIRKAELLYGPEVVREMREREQAIIRRGYRE